MFVFGELSDKTLLNAVVSEESLDVFIPSYPGTPRSLSFEGSLAMVPHDNVIDTVRFLHQDNELLVAAETGSDEMIEILLRLGANVQVKDHLGRNALHLAVTAGNERAIMLLLRAGIDVTVKDNVGMTPLLLSLMRRPSAKIVRLLFDHGECLLPRSSPMDTGLFIQFAMMCTPTAEEEEILRILVEKGAEVNDPEAPGQRQALHFAAMSNNCALVRILIKLGANPELKNHRNETAREVALHFQCKEAAALLAQIEDGTFESSPVTRF